MQQAEASQRRLGTDYIDLYGQHSWDRHTPLQETMSALNDLVQAGKVRYAGLSDTPAWAVARAGRAGWVAGHIRDSTFDVLDVLQQISEELGTSVAAVALAWVASRPEVTSTIIGARTVAQLDFPAGFLATTAIPWQQGGTTINEVAPAPFTRR
jgi:aryl-alcohol dehydrogenase-like predicted oxidoreductase